MNYHIENSSISFILQYGRENKMLFPLVVEAHSKNDHPIQQHRGRELYIIEGISFDGEEIVRSFHYNEETYKFYVYGNGIQKYHWKILKDVLVFDLVDMTPYNFMEI